MKRTPLPPCKKPLKRSAIKRKVKGATTIERMLGEGLISKASCLQSKQKPIRKRRPKRLGEQTQIELFKEIWGERPHVCEIYGTPLGDTMQPIFMSHLLPKGSYRKMKDDKRNIRIQSPKAHMEWHKYGPASLAFNPLWRKTCELYYALRDEANGVSSE